jgi:SAM-dependent methyltransferase
MLDLIGNLPAGARVLDLGAGAGSFVSLRTDLVVVRLDQARPHALGDGRYVLGDAARMPYRSAVFDLVISNHSLEHFHELGATVAEIGRVLKRDGVLYVAVPDATTLTDRIYRWLGRGGGHVNPFRSSQEVAALVAGGTGLPLRATTVLFSSLSFLNRHNFITPPPRRIALFAFGNEFFLAILMWMLRGIDRRCGTKWSRYGWSFRFGNTAAGGVGEAWVNVCVRCGAGHSEAYLRKHAAVRWMSYRCPACGGFNLLTREFAMQHGFTSK